ncbi:MAG: hypothetical protein COT45_02390 [bacterium (Candidatus Stahlbacteria) CG08_land_8_20_14_0_20_40_26]|nr:MAG: hypothetical protein COX49_04420 [bacterium (Candidatus Stahlbacteria) CG23_combo_of_CG06-09_8_20_14_all_40_9]PIS25503.1 MAG: hypothetical protein COT45_02390 [bacterium (Candidatus Stahlbacteria) CG08_land_8_20_14_0_20_40_26]
MNNIYEIVTQPSKVDRFKALALSCLPTSNLNRSVYYKIEKEGHPQKYFFLNGLKVSLKYAIKSPKYRDLRKKTPT